MQNATGDACCTEPWATLQVDAEVAMWISREQWHPMQEGKWLDDGSYELKVPYAEPLELAMDVLRYYGKVRVTASSQLLEQVRRGSVRLLGPLSRLEGLVLAGK